MDILYIGNFAPLGSPLGYSPIADYILYSIEQLGHRVNGVNECTVTAEDVIEELKAHKYDLVLTEEARLKGDHEGDDKGEKTDIRGYFTPVMEYVRERNIPIVAWLTNIFYGLKMREIQITQNPIFKADIVFSTDGGHQKEFSAAGVNHVLLRQGIYEPEAVLGEPNPDIKAEIVFIGAIYEHIWPYRKKLVQWLEKTYKGRFAHYGQRGEVRHQALADMIASVKIVIGDSVYCPYYWSNRIYEMIGRGAFFVHPRVEGLNEEFNEYKHFIPYDIGNFGQLKEIIDYYSDDRHKLERDRIRLAGYEHCRRAHTYLIRVKEMMKVLKERKII